MNNTTTWALVMADGNRVDAVGYATESEAQAAMQALVQRSRRTRERLPNGKPVVAGMTVYVGRFVDGRVQS